MNHNPLGIFSILLSLAAVATAGAGFYQVHIARFDFGQAMQRLALVEERQNTSADVARAALDKASGAESESTYVKSRIKTLGDEIRADGVIAATARERLTISRLEGLEHKLKVLELAVEPLRFDRRPTEVRP